MAAYHHGDLRQALIDITIQMINNDEAHKIGFRELARRIAVSRTAPYRHFDSIQHLLATVAEEGFKQFSSELEAVFNNKKYSSKEKFLELGVYYVNFAREHPAHYRLMFDHNFYQDDRFPNLKEVSKNSFGILKSTVAKCLPDASESEHLNLASLAWCCVHGISKLIIDGQLTHIDVLDGFVRNSCARLIPAIINCVR